MIRPSTKLWAQLLLVVFYGKKEFREKARKLAIAIEAYLVKKEERVNGCY